MKWPSYSGFYYIFKSIIFWIIPDCQKNAGDELCECAKPISFIKKILSALHPAEFYNYSQNLVHHGDHGSCYETLNLLILTRESISENFQMASTVSSPRNGVHFFFPLRLVPWHDVFFWFAGDFVTPHSQMQPEDRRKERSSRNGEWNACFSSHLSYALLPSCPGHLLNSTLWGPTVLFLSGCVGKMVGSWNKECPIE